MRGIFLLRHTCITQFSLITDYIILSPKKIRDFSFGARKEGAEEENEAYNDDSNDNVVDQSSSAFSIMCIFFTVMYAAFATLVFYNSNILLEESVADARIESMPSGSNPEMNTAPGYIGGDRFGVGRSTYGKGTKNIEVL